MTAYCIDAELPPGQERTREAVLRSQRAIAAQEEIYRALRRGDLEARARRNGAGDVETVAPNQWLSLKFQSWNGHDLAVPIDIEQNTLHPHPEADYLSGRVAIDTRPAAWPDPLFAAYQVMQIWPPHEPKQAASPVEVPPRTADKPALTEPLERPDGVSAKDWATFVSARQKGYDLGVWGKITAAARSIARDRGHQTEFESERRALHRVLEALRKKK
jgi:hypothetical protein